MRGPCACPRARTIRWFLATFTNRVARRTGTRPPPIHIIHSLSLQNRGCIVSAIQPVMRPDPHIVLGVPAPACLGDVEGDGELGPAFGEAQGDLGPGADAADGIDGFYAARADGGGGF